MDLHHHLHLLVLPLLSVCLLSCSGTTSGETVRVTVGSEAVLPCFIKPRRDIRQKVFDWKKDDQKEVFFYEKGQHYNNGREGQDEQFKGRVFHFQDQLQSGVASIRINNTKPTDSGTYTCDYLPEELGRQTYNIELVVSAVVNVNVGSEAVLPCFVNPRRDIRQDTFDWKKDPQKEVFFYEKGLHYNNGREGQDEQFKGRVSHFPDQLQSGVASIVIRDTKLSDSGTYTCDISPGKSNSQTYNIKLVVDACPKPSVTILKQTRDWAILWCKVQGVSPKPEVEWQDSSGNNITAEETLVSKTGGSYDIILKTTVTKTDNYSCVVTQKEICHQTSEKISAYIHGAATEPSIKTLKETKDWSLLQCVIRGASPKPEVKWQDSSGNILPAEEPQVTERGGSYDIILQTTVTKTDKYRCVVTQEEINHQAEAETYVHISGPEPPRVSGFPTGHVVVSVIITLLVVGGVLLAGFCYKCYKSRNSKKGPQTKTERDVEKNFGESAKLKKSDTNGD